MRELIYGELAETVVADEGGGGAPLRQSSRCPFSELLLPVAAAGGDLDGAIREALRPSELEGFVGPSGRRAGSAHKEVALLSLPQLLCLQLQRVTYDAEAGRARKLDASVAFPLLLTYGPISRRSGKATEASSLRALPASASYVTRCSWRQSSWGSESNATSLCALPARRPDGPTKPSSSDGRSASRIAPSRSPPAAATGSSSSEKAVSYTHLTLPTIPLV